MYTEFGRVRTSHKLYRHNEAKGWDAATDVVTDLSRRQNSFLDLAVKLAETSDVVGKQHGCIVVKGSRVLAMGVNKWRNRWLPPTPSNEYNPYVTFHAEADALSRIGDAAGATLYIARINARKDEMFSRPCSRCQELLVKAGVKRVIYTMG